MAGVRAVTCIQACYPAAEVGESVGYNPALTQERCFH